MADDQNQDNQSGGERIFALTSYGRVVSDPNLLQGVIIGGEEMESRQQQQQTLHWSDEDSSPQIDKTGNSSFNDFLYDGGDRAAGTQNRREDNRRHGSSTYNAAANNTSNDVPEITTEDEAEVLRIAGSDYLDQNVADSRSTEIYVNSQVGTSVDDEGKTKETLDSRDFKDRSDGYFDRSIGQIHERYDQHSSNKQDGGFDASSSSGGEPTGCFDRTKDEETEMDGKPFFKRCFQKKYIVLGTTALSMLLALTTAIILTINVFHVTSTRHLHNDHYHGDYKKSAESAEMYQKASIASDSGYCSGIGSEILKQNGSAVDAAIAVCFCIGVANRYSSGIGGGGYMVIYNRENRTFEALDFRESAPGRIKSNAFDKDYNASRYGGMAIGVPGEVKGLHLAWQKHGKISWGELVQPAIDLSLNGVPASQALIDTLEMMFTAVQADPGLSNLYLDKNGDIIKIGTHVIDTELAVTLKTIRDKPNDFYAGDLAAKIVRDVKEAGGDISFDDLQNYKVVQREVIHSTIDNLDIHTMSAPSGGPVVMAIINILKGYNFKREDIERAERAPLTYHRIVEAMKFAFAEKSREGDPDFNAEYEKALISNMTSEEIGSKYRRLINDSFALNNNEYYGTEYFMLPNESGTTHVSIVAENGDAVAVSTTINEWFGSTNRSSVTGIVYNNEMNDFAIPQQNISSTPNIPVPPMNSVRSGKRPTSSMSPMILTDRNGDVKMVVGGVGGKRIIPAVAQVLMNKVWFQDDLGQAVSRPRVYNFLQPPITYVEGGDLIGSIVPYFEQCNQAYEKIDPHNYAAVMAVYVEKKENIFAKSDLRKISGHSAGY